MCVLDLIINLEGSFSLSHGGGGFWWWKILLPPFEVSTSLYHECTKAARGPGDVVFSEIVMIELYWDVVFSEIVMIELYCCLLFLPKIRIGLGSTEFVGTCRVFATELEE